MLESKQEVTQVVSRSRNGDTSTKCIQSLKLYSHFLITKIFSKKHDQEALLPVWTTERDMFSPCDNIASQVFSFFFFFFF